MNKIPTLFVRDFGPESRGRYVTRELTPGCGWVLAGEGVPTRKFDGTCMMFDGDRWWSRREVKAGKEAPAGFVPLGYDEVTGKTVGWEPAEASGFAKFWLEAIDGGTFEPGTYELIGPKINKNPEGWANHFLVRHGIVEMANPEPITYETLREALTSDFGFEGIVWHHPDGRMAKLKVRDFPRLSDTGAGG